MAESILEGCIRSDDASTSSLPDAVSAILSDTCATTGKALEKKIPKAHKTRVENAFKAYQRRWQAAYDKYEETISPFKSKVETYESKSQALGKWFHDYVKLLRSQFGMTENQAEPEDPTLKYGGGTYADRFKILEDTRTQRSKAIEEAFSGADRETYEKAIQTREDEFCKAEALLAAVIDFVIGIYNCHIKYKNDVARIRAK